MVFDVVPAVLRDSENDSESACFHTLYSPLQVDVEQIIDWFPFFSLITAPTRSEQAESPVLTLNCALITATVLRKHQPPRLRMMKLHRSCGIWVPPWSAWRNHHHADDNHVNGGDWRWHKQYANQDHCTLYKKKPQQTTFVLLCLYMSFVGIEWADKQELTTATPRSLRGRNCRCVPSIGSVVARHFVGAWRGFHS